MGATPRGDYVCTGNDSGGVFVFDTASGGQVAHVSPIRVRFFVTRLLARWRWTSDLGLACERTKDMPVSRMWRLPAASQVAAQLPASHRWQPCSGHAVVCPSPAPDTHHARQVTAPVRACGLSADCRHLLAACGNGYVFRFEYAGPALGAADGTKGDSGGNDDQ